MRKNVKISYNNSGEIIEIKIRDYSGRYVESFKFNGCNGSLYGKILEGIYLKYGFKPSMDFFNNVNEKEKRSGKVKEDTGDDAKTNIFDY